MQLADARRKRQLLLACCSMLSRIATAWPVAPALEWLTMPISFSSLLIDAICFLFRCHFDAMRSLHFRRPHSSPISRRRAMLICLIIFARAAMLRGPPLGGLAFRRYEVAAIQRRRRRFYCSKSHAEPITSIDAYVAMRMIFHDAPTLRHFSARALFIDRLLLSCLSC